MVYSLSEEILLIKPKSQLASMNKATNERRTRADWATGGISDTSIKND